MPALTFSSSIATATPLASRVVAARCVRKRWTITREGRIAIGSDRRTPRVVFDGSGRGGANARGVGLRDAIAVTDDALRCFLSL